ncbi:MAG: hypothetical protein CVU39_06975 [Chloroflexi bacterium HGW-Chloroflexi-10]|nr:MAG: hypothetical protein CVU39_06975 [Chloroflexi bacterium HGW-Chloroflexi-10]
MALKNPFIKIFHHPAIIISILILLVNDHLLKHTMPSWFTGKLSDFAGLFFFPFLLASGLFSLFSPIHNKKKLSTKTWLLISFTISSVLFAAMKTIPIVNHLMVTGLSMLINTPVQIILDPGDLIALVSFIPGWLIFKNLGKPTNPISIPEKRSWCILSLAIFASIASTPSPLPPIEYFLSINDQIYLGSNYQDPDLLIYNGENTWRYVENPVESLLENNPDLYFDEKVVCLPSDVDHCFRIKNEPYVEESTDKGKTWAIAWQIPPGRKIIYDRLERRSVLSSFPDAQPVDLIFNPVENQMMVSMHDEGLLIRKQDGTWEQIPLIVVSEDNGTPTQTYFEPTTIYAKNISEAFGLLYLDLLVLFGIFTLLVLIFSYISWKKILSHIPHKQPELSKLVNRRTTILNVLFLLIAMIWVSLVQDIFPPVYLLYLWDTGFVFVILILICFYAILIDVWDRIIRETSYNKHVKKAFLITLLGNGLLLVGSFLIFTLWAYGTIENHLTAQILCLIFGLVILVVSGKLLWQSLKIDANEDLGTQ